MQPLQHKQVFQFGAFHLDVDERVLLNDGQRVQLSPKAFDTLVLLVRNSGRLVDKATLLGTVWQNSFVEENVLNRSISLLRKALGESDTIKYIETVPKHGYRFVAEVVEVQCDNVLVIERHTAAQIVTEVEDSLDSDSRNASGNQPVLTDAASSSKRLSRFRRFALPMAGLVTCLLAALAYSMLNLGPRGGKNARIRSIAVLPFKTIDGDKENEHRGIGLTDLLITRLSNIKEINVRPTSAIMGFDNQQADSITIGSRLGVDAVLEGTIYRAQDRVRITARFIKVDNQTPIWAGQFEKPLDEELRLQDEIAFQVVDALALTLSGKERTALTKRYTESADAYQLYSKGRYLWARRDNVGLSEAERLFRSAIAEDPNFALAYVGLADKLMFAADPSEAGPALAKALDLDPNLAEAYASRGFLNTFHRWDWQNAEADFKKSIELNPGCEKAHQWYATLLMIQRRTDEAKAELLLALEINPLSYNLHSELARAHYFAREYDKAEESCFRALDFYPDFIFAHQRLSDIYFQTGQYDKAIDEMTVSLHHLGTYPSNREDHQNMRTKEHLYPYEEAFQRSGVKAFWETHLQDIRNTSALDNNRFIAAARAHISLGEKDRALANLEKALELRAFLMPFVNADPAYDPLRSEARFQTIMRKMSLAQ